MHIAETSLPPEIDVLDLAPVASEPLVWVVLGTDGRLVRLDCAGGDSRELGRVELQEEPGHEPWFGRPLTPRLHVSTRGDFVAVVNDYASLGAVYDGRTMARTLELDGGYSTPTLLACRTALHGLQDNTSGVDGPTWNVEEWWLE